MSTDTVWLDRDAAGHGWFVDATPGLDDEFSVLADVGLGTVLTGSGASGRMDLVTVLAHELGHVLGRPDLDPDLHATDIMAGRLSPGVRKLAEAAPLFEELGLSTEAATLDSAWMSDLAGTGGTRSSAFRVLSSEFDGSDTAGQASSGTQQQASSGTRGTGSAADAFFADLGEDAASLYDGLFEDDAERRAEKDDDEFDVFDPLYGLE
jgi:hypothetical protein